MRAIKLNDKRGDIAVVLVVFMTVLLIGVSLYGFNSLRKGIVDTVPNPNILDGIYFSEDQYKFYIGESVGRAYLDTYQEYAVNGNYIQNKVTKDSYFKFETLKPDVNERFNELMKEKFVEEVKKYNIENLNVDEVDINIVEGNVNVQIPNYKINSDSIQNDEGVSIVKVNYDANINENINLKKYSLHSFEEIYNAKEKCKDIATMSDKKKCYKDNLKNFNADAVLIRKDANGNEITAFDENTVVANAYSKVVLTSKNKYILKGKEGRDLYLGNIQMIFIDKDI